MYQNEHFVQANPHSDLRNGGASPRDCGSVKNLSFLRLVGRWIVSVIASVELVRVSTCNVQDDYKQWFQPTTREDIVSAWLVAAVTLLTLLVV